MFTCTFCNKTLSTKGVLKTHQQNTKLCLEKQKIINSKSEDNFLLQLSSDLTCNLCNKNFKCKQNKERHDSICPLKDSVKLRDKNVSLKSIIDSLISKLETTTNENTQLKLELEKQKVDSEKQKVEIYSSLFNKDQDFIIEQSKILAQKSGTTNNIKSKIVNMNTLNLSKERLESLKDTYTLKHYERGGAGQADWVVDTIITDENGIKNYKCTDKNRGSFVFLDDKRNVICDLRAEKLKEEIRPAIEHKLREYKKEKYAQLAEVDDNNNELAEKCALLHAENIELGPKFLARLVEDVLKRLDA